MPKIRNILIFTGIAAVLILVYIFLIKPSSSDQANLVSSSNSTTSPSGVTGLDTSTTDDTSSVASGFLSLLLNVKNIQLNTDIFSDPAFTSLHDSSIVLVPDAITGRPNPFAQFGAEDSAGVNNSNSPSGASSTPNPPSTNNSTANTTASLGN